MINFALLFVILMYFDVTVSLKLISQCQYLRTSQHNHHFITSTTSKSFSSLKGSLDDDDSKLGFKDASDSPKIGIQTLDEMKNKKNLSNGSSSSSNSYSVSKNIKRSATFGSLTVEDLKSRMVAVEGSQSKELPKRIEDLNGINPFVPVFASAIPFTMSFFGYKLSSYFALKFAVDFLSSDIYTVQRVAIVSRNVLVGLTTLATTFSFVIGLGLLILGLTVGVGVVKGELDPSKKPIEGSQVNEDGTVTK